MIRIKYFYFLSFLFWVLITAPQISCRKHRLILENDTRKYFRISSFGFLSEGELDVSLNYLAFHSSYNPKLGFTLTKTVSDSITPYMETHQNKCLLTDDASTSDGNIHIVSFLLNFKDNNLLVNCSRLLPFLEISPNAITNMSTSKELPKVKEKSNKGVSPIPARKERSAIKSQTVATAVTTTHETPIPMQVTKTSKIANKKNEKSVPFYTKTCNSFAIPFKSVINDQKRKISELKFTIHMKGHKAEGLYSLYFHNCANDPTLPVNLSINIEEKNGENYLSAGEMPLPKLYFMMSFIFFITGCVWTAVLRRKREETFKIHYLMGLLVFIKSLSLLFHGVNYKIISKDGYPMEAWAVLYYITHLLKGALLFITIVLIGTGWAFIKHILSDKDKKIFMIVIPLQVLANVAKIIMEESEEGESQHSTWREIFILVDLVCCGAILFPVVWSIRHLQEASQTDGKAAINLEKLKLFRHFYVMIVCYIYFTRIIVYLLKITVPFQYEWLDEVFRETATVTFFIVTGINFQPTTANPYFRLSQDDLEMDEVITQTGFTENVTKTLRSRDTSGPSEEGMATKRESSHEYD